MLRCSAARLSLRVSPLALGLGPGLVLGLVLGLALVLAHRDARAAFGVDDPVHGFVGEVAVDADPAGNTAGAVGGVDAERVVSLGGVASVDVVVDEISDLNTLLEPGCDDHEESGCGLTRMQLVVTYDPQLVRVVDVDPSLLLCLNGCPNRVSGTDAVPDTDGAFFVDEHDDVSTPETGEGVLVRVTFECMAPGRSPIDVKGTQTSEPWIFDASGGIYPVGTVTKATLTCLEATTVPGQADVSFDLSGDPFDADETGWRILNTTPVAHKVEWTWLPGPPLRPDDTVQPGFALIDGTLLVQSSIPPGELRARYRIEYDVRAARRAGIRAGELRLMRRDAQSGRWARAVRAIRGRASGRYLPRTESDFTLGHHGYSEAKGYVWAVVDVNSRYAIGGPLAGAAIPALGPLGLLAVGAALLGATGWELRRRR